MNTIDIKIYDVDTGFGSRDIELPRINIHDTQYRA